MVSKELVAASSKPIVLSILARGESYGYEIIKKVRTLSGERLEWTDGMLYPVLHRLERDGLIKGFWRESELGRKRRYYRITTAGEAALSEELEHWSTVNTTLNSLQEVDPCLCC